MPNLVKYEKKKECLNAITHWLGVLIGIVALVVLLFVALKENNASKIVSFSIYGATFILMYLASAIYHSIKHIKIKSILRVFDHAAIFLFIAGSYTPIAILSFEGAFRIITMVLVWSIALFGVFYKIYTYGKFESTKRVSLFLYLAMGWISVFMLKPIIDSTSLTFMLSLALGGLMYTIGTIFYANKKIPYNHAIWHLFVLGGSIVHFTGIYHIYG